MKLAFIILAHKHPEQLLELINKLKSDGDHFYIHIDKKSNSIFHELKESFSTNDDIIFIDKNVSCRWGQFSIVEATLNAIMELCHRQIHYDYVFLMSGQDYPIKSVIEMKSCLKEKSDLEYLEAFPLKNKNRWTNQTRYYQALKRVYHFHLYIRSHHFYIPISRKMPKSLTPYGGHQWWVLSGECIKYIMEFTKKNPRVIRFFRKSLIPDELFFQTVVCNSPFKDKVAGYNMTYTDWENPNPMLPRTLTEEDITSAMNSGCFFARKIEPEKSLEFIKLLNERYFKA